MYFNDRDQIIALTPAWQGERFDDGRPRVPDAVLDRFRKLILEEAWDVMNSPLVGSPLCYQMGLKNTHNNKVLVGRAYTAAFLPFRPDLDALVKGYGKAHGLKAGQNQWIVDALQPGDVAVIDIFGKIVDGTFAGGNLAKAIAYNTKGGGLVVWGGIRDVGQISGLPDLQMYYLDDDASFIRNVSLTTINGPVRIGQAACLPGDVVFATPQGVLFVPPHLAEFIASEGEKTHFKDEFCFQRLDEGIYRVHEVHSAWTDAIIEDFERWFKACDKTRGYQYLDFTQDWKRMREFRAKMEAENSKQ